MLLYVCVDNALDVVGYGIELGRQDQFVSEGAEVMDCRIVCTLFLVDFCVKTCVYVSGAMRLVHCSDAVIAILKGKKTQQIA